jgi:hypothetical protein
MAVRPLTDRRKINRSERLKPLDLDHLCGRWRGQELEQRFGGGPGILAMDANREAGERLDVRRQHAADFSAGKGQDFADLGKPDLGLTVGDRFTGGFDGY